MRDADCVALLQWALPRLGLRWRGFRRVRRQVCKRIARRMAELGLADADAYRAYLESHPQEWRRLDGYCFISISRFYRDRGVFDCLGAEILPALARAARAAGRKEIAAWSAGCASGEEPYSLVLVWRFAAAPAAPGIALRVTATDADAHLLARARTACYPPGALKELPPAWRERAFERRGRRLCLRRTWRAPVAFLRQDLREQAPPGPFDLVLCRNLAFTYFDEAGQRAALARLHAAMRPGGALVLGRHEDLPAGAPGFAPWRAARGIFRRGDG